MCGWGKSLEILCLVAEKLAVHVGLFEGVGDGGLVETGDVTTADHHTTK